MSGTYSIYVTNTIDRFCNVFCFTEPMHSSCTITANLAKYLYTKTLLVSIMINSMFFTTILPCNNHYSYLWPLSCGKLLCRQQSELSSRRIQAVLRCQCSDIGRQLQRPCEIDYSPSSSSKDANGPLYPKGRRQTAFWPVFFVHGHDRSEH